MVKKEELARGDYVKVPGIKPTNPGLQHLTVFGRVVSLDEHNASLLLSSGYGLGQFIEVRYDELEGPIPDCHVPIGVLQDTGGHINLPELGIVQ